MRATAIGVVGFLARLPGGGGTAVREDEVIQVFTRVSRLEESRELSQSERSCMVPERR